MLIEILFLKSIDLLKMLRNSLISGVPNPYAADWSVSVHGFLGTGPHSRG